MLHSPAQRTAFPAMTRKLTCGLIAPLGDPVVLLA